MKRRYTLCLLCFISSIVMSCGTYENSSDNSETTLPTIDEYITPSPETIIPTISGISEVVPTVSPDTNIEGDRFVGEYNDVDTLQPNLEIKKLEDGTYEVEIGIFRTYLIDPCPGKLVDDRIEFSSDQVKGKTLKGTIILDEKGNATVRFISGLWEYLNSTEDYFYYKTSDIPYEHYYEY